MPNASLADFKSKLVGGGARPNLFEVSIPALPEAAQTSINDETFKFLCKASNLPASNIAEVVVPFRGRNFKVAGDRTVDPWTVTVINDENFEFRSVFEQWANGLGKLDNGTGATQPASYMTNAYVRQLGRGDSPSATTNGSNMVTLREYKFVDIWPSSVSEISVSYDEGNAIEQFDVTFQVQTFEVSGGEGPTIS
jgi:hypothetical protein